VGGSSQGEVYMEVTKIENLDVIYIKGYIEEW